VNTDCQSECRLKGRS